MRNKAKLSEFVIFTGLLACLFTWTAIAFAGGGTAFGSEERQEPQKGLDKAVVTGSDVRGTSLLFPKGFDGLFDKVYHEPRLTIPGASQETEDAEDSETGQLSRLSLRLYGGYSRIAAGDVNEGCDGYFELFELYDALGIGTASGGYSPLHSGYNFGADVIFQLSPNLGLGVGIGYLQSSRDSRMTISVDTDSLTLTGTPNLSAMPIRLGVFLTLPLSGKIDLTADAGAAYYAGLKLEAEQRLEFPDGTWEEMALSGSRSRLTDNIGFQGSLGFEYKISRKMAFFVEGAGRYASFKNFDSVTGTNTDNEGGSDTNEGKLYIATYTFTEGTFSTFTIEETPPTPDPPDVTYREPKIDLSGFSLQAGIRIRF